MFIQKGLFCVSLEVTKSQSKYSQRHSANYSDENDKNKVIREKRR